VATLRKRNPKHKYSLSVAAKDSIPKSDSKLGAIRRVKMDGAKEVFA
jgi:hypothetical protein